MYHIDRPSESKCYRTTYNARITHLHTPHPPPSLARNPPKRPNLTQPQAQRTHLPQVPSPPTQEKENQNYQVRHRRESVFFLSMNANYVTAYPILTELLELGPVTGVNEYGASIVLYISSFQAVSFFARHAQKQRTSRAAHRGAGQDKADEKTQTGESTERANEGRRNPRSHCASPLPYHSSPVGLKDRVHIHSYHHRHTRRGFESQDAHETPALLSSDLLSAIMIDVGAGIVSRGRGGRGSPSPP
ncbi:hypothetical protein BU24DRAFT_414831 [Aaosphaeria arxii CBS 175.79]|uniref:Uncharacterized protein n=1 Tax=Aaosphaeria arxii CBS 175.79 TaxID=1450172 RepID=A0A6A5X982_9PLEO|nr:uncharacterized protein BU24DRAFT_414831 [Aaosphaeria arxii CBS 175.79]KAF2009512.1 hypothetical protein BU24DRAFT_414831 [Aaosphaeria arxii CBS 175.79]